LLTGKTKKKSVKKIRCQNIFLLVSLLL